MGRRSLSGLRGNCRQQGELSRRSMADKAVLILLLFDNGRVSLHLRSDSAFEGPKDAKIVCCSSAPEANQDRRKPMVLHRGRACCLVDSQWSALSSDAVDKGHGLDRANCGLNTSDPAFRGLHDMLLQTDVVVSIVCISHFVEHGSFHTLGDEACQESRSSHRSFCQ